jgi:predicted kinase
MDTKPVLYIIQGLVGSGKTTFSKKLVAEKNAVHLCPDEWVTNLFTKAEYMADWNKCFDDVLIKLWNKTIEHLTSGESVIFDMGFWYKKDRNFARVIASECSADLVHYHLVVPDEILKERIISSRPKEWADKHLEKFDENKLSYEAPTPEENAIVINNY